MAAKSQNTSTELRLDPVEDYALRVVTFQEVAGPLVRAACRRHLEDLHRASERGLIWRLEKAHRAIDFFPDVLRLVDVEVDQASGMAFADLADTQPFNLTPFQQFIVGSLFGWYTLDGFRRFRVGYVEIGKGNGKSPMAAGIGVYMMTADGARNAEVYAAATVKDQARILYRDAVNMVDASEELFSIIEKHGEKEVYNLVHRKSGSFFKAISSEKRGLDGKRVHCALLDEVHEHPSSVVCDKMRAGTKGRQNALIFEITNSGFDRNSVCFQHHQYSQRVVSGEVMDDSWFAFVCSMDYGDDPFTDKSCWKKANPNLGVSIQQKYLEEQLREARGIPSKASLVRRLNFCEWVDAANPWVEGKFWRACEVDFDLSELAGRTGYAATDLSGTRDLTASAMAFPNDDGSVDAFVEFWTPEETIPERETEAPYSMWVEEGYVHATPGRSVDYAFVAQRFAELQDEFDLEDMAFDPYRIKYLERDLDHAGIRINLIPHGQGFYKASDHAATAEAKKTGDEPPPALWMPRSLELLEDLVLKGKLRVKFNKCLQWNSASAVIEADPKGNRIFTKRRSKGRIDGLVALTMAVGLALNGRVAKRPRKYQVLIV